VYTRLQYGHPKYQAEKDLTRHLSNVHAIQSDCDSERDCSGRKRSQGDVLGVEVCNDANRCQAIVYPENQRIGDLTVADPQGKCRIEKPIVNSGQRRIGEN
jgi:hypothetical protein